MKFDHIVPVSCKGGMRFRSGRRWVAELTGTGSECVSIVNNAAKWLVRTRAHKKLHVIPVKWLPCKCGTKLDFVPDRNLYWYHVNTPLWCTPLGRNIISGSRSLLFRAKLKIMIQMAHSSNTSLNIWTLHCVFYKLKAKKQSRIDLYAVVLWPYFNSLKNLQICPQIMIYSPLPFGVISATRSSTVICSSPFCLIMSANLCIKNI